MRPTKRPLKYSTDSSKFTWEKIPCSNSSIEVRHTSRGFGGDGEISCHRCDLELNVSYLHEVGKKLPTYLSGG